MTKKTSKITKLNSLEQLECLLSEEERRDTLGEIQYKELVASRPFSMQTRFRVLPLLPRWMKNKLIEAKELFNNNNTDFGDDLYWNHTITLPLDEKHDIIFAILDWYGSNEHLKDEMKTIIEVYKDLQVLYRKYGYPLTLESLQRADFGMYLPCSFYDNESDSHDDTDMNHRFLTAETPIEDIIEVFLEPRYTLMRRIERHAEYYSESLDEKERVKFNTWFAYRHKSLMDYYYKMGGVLEHSSYDYYTQPMWDCIDLYMNKERDWDREFCVKWNIGESLSHLKKLDSLRPLIDSIIEKTRDECFAFGVKVRNTEVVWSNQPNAR